MGKATTDITAVFTPMIKQTGFIGHSSNNYLHFNGLKNQSQDQRQVSSKPKRYNL